MSRRPERTARFRVDAGALAAPEVSLRGDELHHLRSVLRLGAGDRVELFDGAGAGAVAEIVHVGRNAAELRLLERVGAHRESALEVTLAVALSRSGKLDWVVEKATELGVRRIVPFASERSTRRGAKVERWRKLASAAAAQSGRVAVPEIAAVAELDGVIGDDSPYDRKLFFWERAEEAPPTGRNEVERVLLVTGPEGGFTPAEAERAAAAGFTLAGLGPRILRAETAAIVAVTLCQLRWGDLAQR